MKKTPDSPFEGDIRTEADEDARHLRVEATVELPPGAEVQLTIHYRPDEKTPFRSKVVNLTGGTVTTSKHLSYDLEKMPVTLTLVEWVRTWWQKFSVLPGYPAYLLFGALLVYYLVRLIRLPDFPIFFFTDEAVHTMLASDLVTNGFASGTGEILPTFFQSGEAFNAGFPVYLQLIPVLLGIRTVFMTRFVSVTTSLLAAGGLGLIFSQAHNERRGWLAVLILSLMPAWFYHSRTAFETVIAVSFYTFFLLGYLKYRNGDFRWLYVSFAAGALSFYSYSPAQVVVAVTAVLLLISDARYHWQNRRFLWKPVLVLLALSLPYFRFLYLHPGANVHHLELLSSYWPKSTPLSAKLLQYFTTYLRGFSPVYWFFPNNVDLPRHIMKGLGHLGWYCFPFFIGGLILALRRWKNTNYRLMLLSLIAAPTGAAVADIAITRALFMVIPAAFFTAIGVDYGIEWLRKRLKIEKFIDVPVFLLLTAGSFFLLDYALTEGPTWYTDYGMSGMQYGSEQVFGRIKEIRKQDPKVPIVLSPDWANGTDVLTRYYLGDPMPIEMASLNAYVQEQRVFSENTIFILPPDDFNIVINSRMFEPMKVIDVIFYPDGTPGFIFAHLKYSANAQQKFEIDKNTREGMDGSQVLFNGEKIEAASSRLDMGELQELFDDSPATLIRTQEANPMVLEFIFPHPITYHSIWVRIGGPATQLSVYVIPDGADTPLASSITVGDAPELRKVSIPLPTDKPITRMRIEIRTLKDKVPTHVHVWDIGLE